jgi:Co/Zn/Cd efflux system component
VDDFFKAVSKYPVFLVSVSLGIFIDAWETRVKPLLTNPLRVVLAVAFFGLAFVGLVFTLKAMLRVG